MCYGLNFWNRCVLTDSAAFLCSMHSVSDMSDSAFIHACFHYTHPKCEENGGFSCIQLRYLLVLELIIKWRFSLLTVKYLLNFDALFIIRYIIAFFLYPSLLPLSPPSIPLVLRCDGVLSVLILLHQGQQDR